MPHRVPAAAAALLACLVSVAAAAQEAARQLLSYEAIPSAQVELDLSDATYAQRAAVAEAALSEIAPAVIDAAGIGADAVETQITPGGYLLRTNASLQSMAALDDAAADRLAAALGYVFRQWSVLVSDLEDEDGTTGFVALGAPAGALDAELAQGFFEWAAGVSEGLGGGYTAFGDTLLFLNVEDDAGAPYSGLSDMVFAARLGEAAASFPATRIEVIDAGFAEARFIGNDWAASPDGEDYAAALNDPALLAELDRIRAAHTALVERMGAGFGWR